MLGVVGPLNEENVGLRQTVKREVKLAHSAGTFASGRDVNFSVRCLPCGAVVVVAVMCMVVVVAVVMVVAVRCMVAGG